MKRLILVTALTAFACTPALAAKTKVTACTTENMAKSAAALNTMPDSPKKWAMAKTLTKVNVDLSKGNMRGACKTYIQAQAAK